MMFSLGPAFVLLCSVHSTMRVDGKQVFAGLQPQASETREVMTLDGLWQFRAAPTVDPDIGFRQHWYLRPLEKSGPTIDMPVPSSYNDITQQASLRDHVGWVWYSRTMFVPHGWVDKRVVLRIGSAHYAAVIYCNGKLVVSHSGGHLPFAADVTRNVLFGSSNVVTIAVNNTLTDVTVPQGNFVHSSNTKYFVYPKNYSHLEYKFDFFNYAGIHRAVLLYTTPHDYIEDVNINCFLHDNGSAQVNYSVSVTAGNVTITLEDPDGRPVKVQSGAQGQIYLDPGSFQLWWPYLMNDTPGKQYTLVVTLYNNIANDVYRQRFGIRHLTWNNTGVYINNKKIYIRGFGKHEDSDIRGKGLDLPTAVKDFNLIKWVGANCFRTSHYPYAEEIMNLADSLGIMVIDETPAVSLDFSGTRTHPQLLENHLHALNEMISRDKNRPSVIMWSLSNEAKTQQHAAVGYYSRLIETARQLDPGRPVTAVLNTFPDKELVAPMLDVICVNRYFGWYSNTGELSLISMQAEHFFTTWRNAFNKPVINSEYGADSVIGLHQQPAFVFSEEYQTRLMTMNFRAFDALRTRSWFIGEMIWNFADFMTQQKITRVLGNRKGIFTRQRQPKMAAHLLRTRYWHLAQNIENHTINMPSDLLFSFHGSIESL